MKRNLATIILVVVAMLALWAGFYATVAQANPLDLMPRIIYHYIDGAWYYEETHWWDNFGGWPDMFWWPRKNG